MPSPGGRGHRLYTGRPRQLAAGRPRGSRSMRRSGVQDLALLRLELGVGQDAGVLQFPELFQLGELVVHTTTSGRFGGRRRCVRLLRGVRLLRRIPLLRRVVGWRRRGLGGSSLVLGGPLVLLSMLDAPGDGAGGARDNSGAGDSADQTTWHLTCSLR